MSSKTRHLLYTVVIGGASFIMIVLIWLTIVWLKRPDYIRPDTSGWHTGDIFFSVGDSWESVAVRSLTGALSFELSDSTPSHCGIVVRTHEGVKLAHASTSAGKIVLEDPEEYLQKNGSYCIYRAESPCKADSAMITQKLDSLIRSEVPFDFEYDHSDPKALYCTEMVVTVHELTGRRCLSGLREKLYIYPKDVLDLCRE